MTQPHNHIAAMAPYALAEMSAPDGIEPTFLSQNESLRGPSAAVIQAAKASLQSGELYPDPDWSDLRDALGDLHGVAASQILCGAGSLDLIGCLARVYSGPDRAILAPEYAYPFFRTAAQMANARFDTANERDASVNVDAVLNAVQPDTGIVFVANPGNPTGTRISRPELMRLRAGLRDDILLVIDEAYGEFADHLNETCFDLVDDRTVVLRTFSKAYSMAGFRVGWGVFPTRVAAEIRKVVNPNNISVVSQAAAFAAVQDQAYMRETCQMTADLRVYAINRLKERGFTLFPSYTNFVLIDLKTPSEARSADTSLKAQGIFLRAQGGAGLPQCLRMTIGPKQALDKAVDALIKWQAEVSK